MASQLGFEPCRGIGNLAPSSAHVARSPVGFAQAVEDCAANAELGECLELHILRAIEAARGFKQPNHTRAHQILHLDMLREPFANARGDVIDLRQFLHDEVVSIGRIRCARLVCQFCCRHLVTSLNVMA